MRDRLPRASIVAALLMIVALPGCGRKALGTAPVRGKVTLGGKPVTQGKVLFLPQKGPMASGELGPDGGYALMTYSPGDGAIVGECSVSIQPFSERTAKPGENRPVPSPRPEVDIPKKYHRVDTSGLKRMVESQENEFDFELSK